MSRPGPLLTMTAALASVAAMVLGTVAPATAATRDYCHGQCNDILPPGNNGNDTLTQLLAYEATKTKPKHTDDQLAKYAALVDGYSGLTKGTLSDYFNSSALGVPANDVESDIHPGGRADVQIVRDKQTGTPHIIGTTRAGTEFGAGYAAGQDRLWMMDVFRHVGRGELSSFAGGAPGNRKLEQQFYLQGAYTEKELDAQIERVRHEGKRGAQGYRDIVNYVAGINQYIADAQKKLSIPGEYVVTGNANAVTQTGIAKFKPSDMVAIATVISALFGSGGGNQVQSALVKLAAEHRYGRVKGDRVWRAFREENDPEAVLTVHKGKFPYASSPKHAKGVAMPDRGSVVAQPVVANATGTAATSGATSGAAAAKSTAASKRSSANLLAEPALGKLRGMLDDGVLPANLLDQHRDMSNALVVGAKHSTQHHPVAVFGPQTGYFAPQLLMLEELDGPGLHARGISFAGLSFYVLIGRGPDYSWSATSASQTNVDTFAVRLCDPKGGRVTKWSTGYRDNGKCRAMQKLVRHDSWAPTIADSTKAGSYDLVAYRTKYGLVAYRATIKGHPVAYTLLRSTYFHEPDGLIGFQMFNDPSAMRTPKQFQHAASHISYTFNWFFVNSRHIAYYNSGLNPTRARHVDANLPTWAWKKYVWRHWRPSTNTVRNTAFTAHPHSIDQSYYVSWNNKIAHHYAMSRYGDGSIYRVNMLDRRVRRLMKKGKVDRVGLTKAMESAAVEDMRGGILLPELLKVIGKRKVTNATQRKAIGELKSWLASGARRRETSAGSKKYAHADAIRIMDAWWPLLVRAEFRPRMGAALYNQMTKALVIDNAPNGTADGQAHQGSAYQHGWYSYMDKDLRAVMGKKVRGGLGVKFCGGGKVLRCRRVLLSTLTKAVAVPATKLYPADKWCDAGDQWCADAIVNNPLGAIHDDATNWQNRPTYQQVVQYPAGR